MVFEAAEPLDHDCLSLAGTLVMGPGLGQHQLPGRSALGVGGADPVIVFRALVRRLEASAAGTGLVDAEDFMFDRGANPPDDGAAVGAIVLALELCQHSLPHRQGRAAALF